MITGYNTDIRHGDRVFHVQTEDKGESNPCIESLVYVGGQILARKRAGYRRLLEGGEGKQAILDLMEKQHRLMIAEIRTGKLDDQVRALVGEAAAGAAAAPALPEAAPPPPVETKTPTGPSLDQVILDYLNSEVEQEHLVLMMDSRGELRLGERALLSFHTQSSKGSRPIAGTRIAVKMISTSTEPQVLASGETNEHGDLNVSIAIPDLKTGTAALIVNAVSEVGTAEIKQLI